MPSSVDDAILEDADTDEVSLPSDVDYSDDETLSLPDPMNSDLEDDFDDIAEFYSPPRVVPVAKEMGLKGDISYDIATGMDFALEQSRAQSLGDLRIRHPPTAPLELQVHVRRSYAKKMGCWHDLPGAQHGMCEGAMGARPKVRL